MIQVIEWIVWGTTFFFGFLCAYDIRRHAENQLPPPLWPSLILAFSLWAVPLIFLIVPYSKFHILWIIPVLYILGNVAGLSYVPGLSQALIWPAYFYASMLMRGSGMKLSSPSRQSPWAARVLAIPLRYLLKGLWMSLTHRRSDAEKAAITQILERRNNHIEFLDIEEGTRVKSHSSEDRT